jgi:hypothetical protein
MEFFRLHRAPVSPGRLERIVSSGALAMFLVFAGAGAHADNEERYDGWYFTAEEVGAAYLYQESYGERLRDPLKAGGCLFRGGEFAVRQGSAHFMVSCRFVEEVTRHLKEMIDTGAAKFLFPLDADHAHLGVPLAAWKKKYQHLPPDEVVPALLRDPGLVALYHTAEHLRVTDRRTGAVDPAAKAWLAKRNVLGYFDRRPIEILSPHPDGQGVSMPEDYYAYSGFSFLASPKGELYLSAGTRIVPFDLAIDATHADDFNQSANFSETRLTGNER